MVEIHPAHMVKVEIYTICFTSSHHGWIHFIYPGIYLRAYLGKGHPELVYITNEKEGTSLQREPHLRPNHSIWNT
jgi:hypothetical protein